MQPADQTLIVQTAASMAQAIANRPQTEGAQPPMPETMTGQLILALNPGDVAQALLASMVVLMSELTKDCLAETGGPEPAARAARAQCLALSKAMFASMTKLDRMQTRAAEEAKQEAEAMEETRPVQTNVRASRLDFGGQPDENPALSGTQPKNRPLLHGAARS